jgi:hypothetical protein
MSAVVVGEEVEVEGVMSLKKELRRVQKEVKELQKEVQGVQEGDSMVLTSIHVSISLLMFLK